MLQPKKTKFRKAFKGRVKGKAVKAINLDFGDYGFRAIGAARVTACQIESVRRTIVRKMKRAGSLWIRIFPDIPVSKKPADVRMGKGKGAVDHWISRVKPGQIMFELSGLQEDLAKEIMSLVNDKLNVKCKFVKRIEGN